MKNLDDFITNIVTKEINEPQEYETAIRNAFNKTSFKKQGFKKIAVTICSLLVITTGIVYATEIKELIIKQFYNYDEGIDTAIENNYIDIPEENYVNSSINVETIINNMSIDAYDTEIGIKNMLMDDYNLDFTFSINVSKNIDFSDIEDIRLYEVLITDENNNILYCNNRDLFNEYCSNNNLNYSYHEHNEHHMNSALTGHIINKDTNSNTIDFIYSLINNRQYAYPKSEKLNIIIQEIRMVDKDVFPFEEKVALRGNWNLFVDVDKKFSNRESVNYTVKNNPYNDIKVTEAKLDNTGFTFKCTILKEPLYGNNTSKEEIHKLITEYHKYYIEGDRCIPNYITNCYLEDEFGNKYYTPTSGNSNPYRFDFSTGELYYKDHFTYTQSVQTNKIKIYFTINLPNDTRKICLELEK